MPFANDDFEGWQPDTWRTVASGVGMPFVRHIKMGFACVSGCDVPCLAVKEFDNLTGLIALKCETIGGKHRMGDDKVRVIGVRCTESCPVIHTPLRQLTSLFPDLNITVMAIFRDETMLIPSSDDQMLPGDEVYFIAETSHVPRAMTVFGHDEKEARLQAEQTISDLRAQSQTISDHMARVLREKEGADAEFAQWAQDREKLQAQLRKKDEMIGMLSSTFKNIIQNITTSFIFSHKFCCSHIRNSSMPMQIVLHTSTTN